LRRRLESLGFSNLVLRNRTGLDLLDPSQVRNFFETEKPEYVFLAAAKVGGIVANRDFPADFIYQNLQIQNHVIHSSYLSGVKKLLFLGSSCIYPKLAPQPLKEEYLLTGLLESSNEPYAIAKIAGIKMCQSYNRQYGTNFIACMPTNLYGPNDNFDLTSSHVLPAMIRKFHEAKKGGTPEVTLWGDGSPLREFLYVDDMADACVHMMQNFNPTKEQNESGGMFLNIGTGKDIAIRELADIVGKTVGYSGKIIWDTSKPNGTPRKLLDVGRMERVGWKCGVGLEEGVGRSYEWYLTH
jgi:GDP-L-fucose synthase